MIRRLVHLLSVLSLLLLATVLALWVRGYWGIDHFWLVYRDEGAELLRSTRGRLGFRHVVPNVRGVPVPRRLSHWSCAPGSQLAPPPSPLHWAWRGVAYEGTPAPTKQEIAGARAALKAVEAARAGADPNAPRIDPADPDSHAGYQAWLVFRQQQLWVQEDSATRVLGGTNYHEWSVPVWLAAAVSAVLPVVTFLVPRYRRRLRRRRGQCPACGYDVRASKERCPECGSAIASQYGSAAAAALPASDSPVTSPP